MLTGYCFAGENKQLDVLTVEEDDFCLFLTDYCQRNGITKIAMDLETRRSIHYGVIDLIHAGFKIIVVDPVYSPINDKHVLPLDVHRTLSTLGNHHPGSVCIGRLLVQMVLAGHLGAVTSLQDSGSESPLLNHLPMTTLGFLGCQVNSKIENEVSFIRSNTI